MPKKKSIEAKLPKTVTILGRKYKVVEVDTAELVDGKEASGVCDSVNREIHIEKGLPPNEKFGILAHEMCHATMDINGLSETLNDREIEMACQTARSVVEDFIISVGKVKRG